MNALKRLSCRVTMTNTDCTVCLDDQMMVQSVEQLPHVQTLDWMGKQIDDDQLGRLRRKFTGNSHPEVPRFP